MVTRRDRGDSVPPRSTGDGGGPDPPAVCRCDERRFCVPHPDIGGVRRQGARPGSPARGDVGQVHSVHSYRLVVEAAHEWHIVLGHDNLEECIEWDIGSARLE